MSKVPQFSDKIQKQTLAEQVASTVEGAILDGQWQAGEALPTEPQLAGSFGVSRAVIRDATRMLAARGLVKAQHGRGVFVTESQAAAFGEALLLALRRNEASVWDVEQFEQMVFPRVCALVSQTASAEELTAIKALGEAYIEAFSKTTKAYWQNETSTQTAELESNRAAFVAFIQAIFAATHNKVWQLLSGPILHLRSNRNWQSGHDLDAAIASEAGYVRALVTALTADDPFQTQETIAQLMILPVEAQQAMRETPVGEIPDIPLTITGEIS